MTGLGYSPEQLDMMRVSWGHKSPADIVHEYVIIRGDLSEQYARDQLARIIQFKIDEARAEGPVLAAVPFGEDDSCDGYLSDCAERGACICTALGRES